MQTQTSNTLHNAIMEAGSKDRPPMLAPGNYIQWKSRIKRYIDTKPNHELIHYCLENPPYELGWKTKPILDSDGNPTTSTERVFETYKTVTQEIRDQLNAEAEAVQIILTGIDNDIYSTVDACPNACEMWKAIERLKQCESINVQDLESNLFWEFGKFTSLDGESLESYYSRFYKMMNEQCNVTNHQVNVQFLLQLQPEWQRFVTLVKQNQELKNVSYHNLYDILKQHQHEVNEIQAEKIARVANPLVLVAEQQPVYHPQTHPTHYNQNSSTRSQQATRNREKAIVNSPEPIYDQEPSMVDDEDDETSKDKEIDKLMALISLSFKKIYKPTNNNLRTSSNTSRANQDNSLRIHINAGYESQRNGNVAGARETVGGSWNSVNAEQAYWKDDTDDESDDQELEAHYMYMAKIQQVSPDAVDSGPIFDKEPEQKVQNDDQYDVFFIECQQPEQSESVHQTYLIEQDAHNVIIESEDINYDSEQIDQNKEDADLAEERELLASLIEKLKYEIDETKNSNTLLETSNKVLVEKFKNEIAYFKNKNKSLTEANNKLSKENDLLYADYKKSKAELKRRDIIEYATEMELECAKVKDEYYTYKKESQMWTIYENENPFKQFLCIHSLRWYSSYPSFCSTSSRRPISRMTAVGNTISLLLHTDSDPETKKSKEEEDERAEVYYECNEPFKSLKYLWVRSKSIAATWLKKVVTPLIEPSIKGFAGASAVLKPKHLKLDRHDSISALCYLVIGGWSGLPPFQYLRSRSEKVDRNALISMRNEISDNLIISITNRSFKNNKRNIDDEEELER
uniref:Gag-Pol polyprotein n=1 Tax=Tanacetum cinerariifolium TaxID=118510 RepID=A0A6L2NSL6_TANCI|nr:Gag-Pol polyprotein [Tanacetum cinerariifolium]